MKAFYQIERPFLGFLKHSPQVFPQDAQKKQLETTKEQNDRHQGGETWNSIPVQQCSCDDKNPETQGARGHDHADVGSQSERERRERGDSVQGKIP